MSDLLIAFHPLAAASPVLADLEPRQEGLDREHAPRVLAHPLPDGRCAVLVRRAADTAANLDRFAPGDGAARAALRGRGGRTRWRRVRPTDVCPHAYGYSGGMDDTETPALVPFEGPN